jgi:hypothetical protein
MGKGWHGKKDRKNVAQGQHGTVWEVEWHETHGENVSEGGDVLS